MLAKKFTAPLMLLGALLLSTPKVLKAQYAINVVAGGGPSGLPALSSNLGYPAGIVRDGLGNTYVADVNSNRILKIDSTLKVTVFAGNGSDIGGEGGFSGDGGPATSAQLGRPAGLALDAAGDLLVADTDNSRIRCVVAAAGGCFGSALPVGSITTVAGNGTAGYMGDGAAAINAELDSPSGVFVDGGGDIFIADTENSVVRCVVGTAGGCLGSALAVGSITTVAGNGTVGFLGDGAPALSAELALPSGVFVDGGNNIWIADTENSVIRCVVGTAGGCFGSALGVGNITTVAGINYSVNATNPPACMFLGDGAAATLAYLCLPTAVFVDASGNLYIVDTDNFVIREVIPGVAPVISTIAGTGLTAGYTGDNGPATSAELNFPTGAFVDSSGDVYIADTNNSVIREVVAGTITTVAGNQTVGYSGDGGTATNASLYASGGTFVDGSGNLFIADTYNNVIRKIAAGSTVIQTVAGSATLGAGYSGDGAAATSAQLNLPGGVFVNAGGDIFIADTENSRVRCVVGTAGGCFSSALAVGSITTVAGTGTPGSTGDGGPANAAELQNPHGVFVDGNGSLFIADTANFKIRCVAAVAGGCYSTTLAVGDITTVAGSGAVCQPAGSACGDGAAATGAQLNFPAGISVDSLGDLFIADTLDSKIREVTAATGFIQTVAGTAAPGYSGDGGPATGADLNEPSGVFVDAFGNLFIADSDNSVVREVVAVTGNIQTVAGNGTQGYAGDPGPAGSAELAIPLGLAGDTLGNVYVADTENSRIRLLTSTVGITLIPASATLPTGGTQQFAATVTGANDTTVTWQVNGVTGGNQTVGTITNLGSYQAPTAIPAPATVTVTAVANANGVSTTSAPVTVVSGATTVTLTLSTSPTVTIVYTGLTQAFTANVTNSANTAVNWEVNGVAGGNATVGTISTSGVYTAPATVPTPATVVIGAVLQANAAVTASYPIVIVSAPTAPQPAPQSASAGGSATYSMSLNAKTGAAKQAMTLSCLKSSLPQGATCTFTPPTIVPGSSAVPFSLTINLPVCAASLEKPNDRSRVGRIYVAFLPMAALLFVGFSRRKLRRELLLMAFLVCVSLAGMMGCGGAGSTGSSCPNLAGTYMVVVQGTTATQPNPVTITTVTLTVH